MSEAITILQPIIEALQPVLFVIIETFVAIAVPALLLKMNAWLESKVHDSRFHCAMEKVTRHAEDAVILISQSYVKDVRRTGTWNGNAAERAREAAKDRMLTLIGIDGMSELRKCLGRKKESMDPVIEAAIERSVVDLKVRKMIKKVSSNPQRESSGVSER